MEILRDARLRMPIFWLLLKDDFNLLSLAFILQLVLAERIALVERGRKIKYRREPETSVLHDPFGQGSKSLTTPARPRIEVVQTNKGRYRDAEEVSNVPLVESSELFQASEKRRWKVSNDRSIERYRLELLYEKSQGVGL